MYLRSHAIADTGVRLILGNWQIWKSSSLMSSNNNAIVAIQVVDEEEAEEANIRAVKHHSCDVQNAILKELHRVSFWPKINFFGKSSFLR